MSGPDLVEAVGLGHSRFMLRAWGWGWVPLVCWIAGCTAASNDAKRTAATDDPRGGQTGSLAPDCGPGKSFETEATLPAGDAAFVYYDGACTTEESDFALSNAAGEPIDFHLNQLPGGGVVLTADVALTPGEYTVATPKGTKRVTVSEPQPLPITLGALEDASGNCAASFVLTFSDEVKPYLSLLSLSYSLDASERHAWFDYGTLAATDQTVRLDLGALSSGSHQLRIRAAIVGESDAPDPLVFDFESSCQGSGDGGGGCAVVAARPFAPAWSWLALLVLASCRRRCPRRQ